MYEIRPATAEDIIALYGKQIFFPSRAWAVDYKNQTVAVAGVYFQPTQAVSFSAMMDGIGAPKRTVFRAAMEIMDKIKSLNLPSITAICTDRYSNSGKLHRMAGFTYRGRTEQGEVYTWAQK
jgi:hypothetical protein